MAEVSSRLRQAAQPESELDRSQRDIDVLPEDLAHVGLELPWYRAACDALWESTLAYMRHVQSDHKLEDLERVAKMFIDMNSERIFDDMLKTDTVQGIVVRTSKAKFQHYVRLRLDPLVRAGCADGWQKRAKPPSAVYVNEIEVATNKRRDPWDTKRWRYQPLLNHTGDKNSKETSGARAAEFTAAFQRVEAHRLIFERELQCNLIACFSSASGNTLDALRPVDLLGHFGTYAEHLLEATGFECRGLFRDEKVFESFVYAAIEWTVTGVLPSPGTVEETLDKLLDLGMHCVQGAEETGAADSMSDGWKAARERIREDIKGRILQKSTEGATSDAGSRELIIGMTESLGAFKDRAGEREPQNTWISLGGDWERVISAALNNIVKTAVDRPLAMAGFWFLQSLRNQANRHYAEQFLTIGLRQSLVATWSKMSAALPLEKSNAEPPSPAPQSGPDLQTTKQGAPKSDVTLLQKANGTYYTSVDFPTAERYADISSRRRQQLMNGGTLKVIGKGQNRRITVESLIAYCPPVEDAK